MITICRFAAALLALGLLVPLPAGAQTDPLRTALEESKASGKGLTFYVKGASIPGVVVSIGEKYVVAKSQAQGQIVIRLESIDAVAGFVGEKKP